MKIGPFNFNHVVGLDFEFSAKPGERPEPICLVVGNMETGKTEKFWEDDLRGLKMPPFPIGPDSLAVAFYASAEMGCFQKLGWQFPRNILDLFTEFRCITNGKSDTRQNLLSVLGWFDIDCLGFAEKEEMRNLAIRGGPFTEEEKRNLLDYCESDVLALYKLLPKMLPHIDVPRALIRGCYMGAAAVIETNGIPVDAPMLRDLEEKWPQIQRKLIQRVDQYGVYDDLTFKTDRFAKYLIKNGIAWPRLPSGRLDLKEQTFEEMVVRYPQLNELLQIRTTLAQMRASQLPVGRDGRNRTILSAFRSVTGRNQPKSKEFIFGRSAWFRHLIVPKPETALAYVDWSQQEFGIAAALSGDTNMIAAYKSGDPYLEFGRQAGVIPAHGTKYTHSVEREQFKQCALAVLYGGGAGLVAMRTGLSLLDAQDLVRIHKKSYPIFWNWIGAAADRVNLGGSLHTVLGWPYHSGPKTKHGTLLNFPMQANGAEMLRLACCNAVRAKIKICAPVHDALLIEAPLHEIGTAVTLTQKIMAEASVVVLGNVLSLRSDVKVIRHPQRYSDARGVKMWDTIQEILTAIKAEEFEQGRQLDPRIYKEDLLHRHSPGQSHNISHRKESII
jgi:hypothetical protein